MHYPAPNASIGVRMNSTLHLRSLCRRIVAAIAPSLLAIAASSSHAIPAAERAVLLSLYNGSQGSSWTNKTGWDTASGIECSWFGVTCSAGDANVIAISLPNNNLVGTLPATLKNLTLLQSFAVNDNKLGGPIPSLAGMTALQTFLVYGNQLSGSLPSLNGLTDLQVFNANGNGLTGTIPAYTGLSNLNSFFVARNSLTGSLPSLTGYLALERFGADNNALTGGIPALGGLSVLRDVYLSNNQLTGSVPNLPATIRSFYASRNQLTGSLPTLSTQTLLEEFEVTDNQLIGSLSSLTNLAQLRRFRVDGNQLSGTVPAPPSPLSSLTAGGSALCPNKLSRSNSPIWDTATGVTPWNLLCVPPFTINQPANVALGGVTINTPSDVFNVTLTNSTVDDGSVTNCTIGGTNASQFEFSPPLSTPFVVPGNQSVSLPVRITGTSVGPKTAMLTCAVSAGGSLVGGPTALAATVGLGCLDADGDGDIDASTDMVILVRAALGFTGARVIDGAIAGTPPRNTWALIRAFLNAKCGTNYAS
jgi:Leucine rich repeat N-terminal domain